MSGNTSNARLWADADVYIAQTLASANPADGTVAFGATWDLVGLLDGEAGFTETRSEEKGDHYAWGGILARTSRRNFKLTKKFTVLEDNDITRKLIWPGSPAGSIVVPKPAKLKLAFQTKDGLTVRRLITKLYAEIDVDGDLTDNESDLTKVPLIATIYPDSTGGLFVEQKATLTA